MRKNTDRLKKFAVAAALTGALGGADSAEAQSVSDRLGALAEQETIQEGQDQQLPDVIEEVQTVEIEPDTFSSVGVMDDGERAFFVDEQGREVELVDGFGHTVEPTMDDADDGSPLMMIEMNGEELTGTVMQQVDGFVYFVPDGFNLADTPQGLELHEEGRSYDQDMIFVENE